MEIPKSFLGYKRENDRVCTRNHVIILPVDDISNACAEAVANNIKGTIALPHSYGRLQFGADLDLHFRTMIGTGKNPNVAAVIVIGIEPKWTKRIVDEIAKTGKPVEGFHIERTGDIGTTMKASKKAQEFVMWASEKQREECPMSDLWISVKCGESDTTSGLAANPTVGNLMDKLEPMGVHLCFGETSELTGAEQVCATRGATPEASEKFMKTWNSYNDFILKEAETLQNNKDYDNALSKLFEVPDVCKECFEKSMDLSKLVYKSKIENECQEKISQANVFISQDNWNDAAGSLIGITPDIDRKSTRLNSSHDQISYAVFCLKKKKKKTI